MKILDYNLYLGNLAVEKIEEEYQMDIYDVIDKKTRSKDMSFIIWACVQEDVSLEQFKKEISKIPYMELIDIRNKLIGAEKNEQSVTESA